MPYIPTDTDCNELNPGMCGGKMAPTYSDKCPNKMLPSMCGDNFLHVIDCEEELSCFVFEFNETPSPFDGARGLMVTLRNDCGIEFAHSTLYHYGVKNVANDAETDTDVYGLSPDVTYFSNVYFYPTSAEFTQGYKDITYTIEATTSDGRKAKATATYRYRLGYAPTCFTKGTKVWTDDGLKNIEDISAGDKVLAYNDLTEENELAEVLNTIEQEAHDLYEISVGGEVLNVTGDHLMYVVSEQDYSAVKYLEAGDELLKQDGTTVTVDSVSVKEGTHTVCNIEVDRLSNYYVGDGGYLSYNMNIADELGISTIKLSPKNMRSVGATHTFNVSCYQHSSYPIGGNSFEYEITPSGNAPALDGSVQGRYTFAIEGSSTIDLALSLTTSSDGLYTYYVKPQVAPTPCRQANQTYVIEVYISEGEIFYVQIFDRGFEKHKSMEFTPSCIDPYDPEV